MKSTLTLLAAMLLAPLAVLHAADTFIVEDGKPRAEIVISDDSHADATCRRT